MPVAASGRGPTVASVLPRSTQLSLGTTPEVAPEMPAVLGTPATYRLSHTLLRAQIDWPRSLSRRRGDSPAEGGKRVADASALEASLPCTGQARGGLALQFSGQLLSTAPRQDAGSSTSLRAYCRFAADAIHASRETCGPHAPEEAEREDDDGVAHHCGDDRELATSLQTRGCKRAYSLAEEVTGQNSESWLARPRAGETCGVVECDVAARDHGGPMLAFAVVSPMSRRTCRFGL